MYFINIPRNLILYLAYFFGTKLNKKIQKVSKNLRQHISTCGFWFWYNWGQYNDKLIKLKVSAVSNTSSCAAIYLIPPVRSYLIHVHYCYIKVSDFGNLWLLFEKIHFLPKLTFFFVLVQLNTRILKIAQTWNLCQFILINLSSKWKINFGK